MLFADLGARQVVADFSGGHLSCDAGSLLLRQVDAGLGLTRLLAGCFHDVRDPRWVEHALPELLRQRLFTLGQGYEDLNDQDRLRRDPLLATSVGKLDPLGLDRLDPRQQGIPLAAPSTLNRLELSNNKATRYHKLSHDPVKIEDCLLLLATRCLPKDTQEIILDLDSMGHLVHGMQEGRYFSGYYDGYCYLPLYVVCGDVVLWAQLRTADADGAAGVVPALGKIVAALRGRFPGVRIVVRGDSGFSRDEVMVWCEGQAQVYYCLGLAKNARLEQALEGTMAEAHMAWCFAGGAMVRRFKEFTYRTLESWSRERRVIGKAEFTAQGANPRFVVTNLPREGFTAEARSPEQQRAAAARFAPEALYEKTYCARGEMENVLKQQTLDLGADRLSTHHMESNQLRLWLATFAYMLVERVRALFLVGTSLARATVGTIRVKLLKLTAQVKVSVRRVHVQLCSSHPLQEVFRHCHAAMTKWAAAPT